MKSFLLAAGEGNRLKPLTDTIPKCLVPINGKPLLFYWIDLFRRFQIDEVLINTHYLPQKVETAIRENTHDIKFHVSYELKLLGSAGTIKMNKQFIEQEEDFYIFYADNLVDVDLLPLLNFHRRNGGIMTIGLFHTEKPTHCGISILDEKGRIVDFEEKPKNPKSNLASAGIFVASPRIIDYIPEKIPVDIGFDLIPQLVGEIYGFQLEGYIRDIGTIESYGKAIAEWSLRK